MSASDFASADVELCREAAGYLDATIHHFGTMRRQAIARQLRSLAATIEAYLQQRSSAQGTP